MDRIGELKKKRFYHSVATTVSWRPSS